MKVRLLVFLAIAAMPLMGFDCINDPFYAALNITPISHVFAVDGVSPVVKQYGPIPTGDYYDTGYSLRDISVYDLKVSTSGPSLGMCTFTVSIKTGTQLSYSDVVTCTGNWDDFKSGVSIFNTNYFTFRNSSLLNSLIATAFNGSTADRFLWVRLTATSATQAASSTSNTVTVSLYVQATGSLNK